MTIIKIKSYNAVRAKLYGKSYSWADRLILQRSYPHTHTEIQFSEKYNSISFSSTIEDEVKGCRFKQIEYSHHERWDAIYINVSENDEKQIYQKAEELVALKVGYDLIGLLSFATPLEIIIPSRNKMWCSEAVLTVLGEGWRLPAILVPDKTHPAMCDMVLRFIMEKSK